jgi:ketosteroid isomerase-like protein
MAFARGVDGVAWTVTQNGATRRHSHSGTYLNVMRKLPDGSWRIQAHMWDDGPERVE